MKKYGPYLIQGYISFVIHNDDGTTTTSMVHRDIMESFLCRKLLKNEHVHHINENKLDNRLDNLMVLTASEHAKHRHSNDPIEKIFIGICPECRNKFEKKLRNVKHNKKLGRAGPFCGRSCAGKYSQRFYGRNDLSRMAEGISLKENSLEGSSPSFGTMRL